MPQIQNIARSYEEPIYAPVATEKELLEFANSVRRAGGGDPIPALLPSHPSNPNTCLIANALNFQSKVDGFSNVEGVQPTFGGLVPPRTRGVNQWSMDVGDNDLATKISAGTGLALAAVQEYYGDLKLYVLLPPHIGNAAAAFDNGAAFQQYKKERF